MPLDENAISPYPPRVALNRRVMGVIGSLALGEEFNAAITLFSILNYTVILANRAGALDFESAQRGGNATKVIFHASFPLF